MEKKIINDKKEQLLSLRAKGKKEALAINAMQAYGKIMGMDTFLWVNPNIDQLATVLASFPFQIIWVATQRQFNNCLNIDSNLSKKIETIVIHDKKQSGVNEASFFDIKNILVVPNSKEALLLMNTLKKEKCAFLFSTEGENAREDKIEFEQFIARYR